LCPELSGLAVYPDDSVFLVSVVFVSEIFCDGARFAQCQLTFSPEAHVLEIWSSCF